MQRFKVVILFMLAALVLSSCAAELSPEERVRGAVKKAAEMVRAKDLKGFMRLVSRDYSGGGVADYDGVKGIVFYEFLKPGALRVFFRDVDVEVEGERAVVNSRAFLVRGKDQASITDVIPADADGYSFKVSYRLEDGEWMVISAQWKSVGVLGLI
jgi:guanyl-specific ribonuclease Sa